MPEPLSICLEDLDAPDGSERYVRCVAVPGSQPGLAVGPRGEILWLSPGPQACQLWISADDKLIVLRPVGADPVLIARDGRSLEAPAGKPVVLLDQDEVRVGSKRLRVHVHGLAPHIHPPTPLADRARAGIAGVAAAVAFGMSALGAAPATKPVEIRDRPPEPMPTRVVPPGPDAGRPDAGAPDAGPSKPKQVPIEIRDQPPSAPDPGWDRPKVLPLGPDPVPAEPRLPLPSPAAPKTGK